MQTRKVLVVDDEPTVVRLTVAILQRAGYGTVAASNGEEALALCKNMKTEIVLVISDVSMPGMNGKELAECVSRMPDPVPVILMSGYSVTSPLIRSMVNGRLSNCHFVAKPFGRAKSLEAVSEALARTYCCRGLQSVPDPH